jgi:hypothetical protein
MIEGNGIELEPLARPRKWPTPTPRRAEVAQWLADFLRGRGPVLLREVMRAAAEKGFIGVNPSTGRPYATLILYQARDLIGLRQGPAPDSYVQMYRAGTRRRPLYWGLVPRAEAVLGPRPRRPAEAAQEAPRGGEGPEVLERLVTWMRRVEGRLEALERGAGLARGRSPLADFLEGR